MNTEEDYRFYFKIVYTDNSFYLSFKPDDTNFQMFVKVYRTLIESNLIDQVLDKIELVETGQYNNVNGRDPELAPCINYPESTTLREIYGDRWKKTSFYIRVTRNTTNDS